MVYRASYFGLVYALLIACYCQAATIAPECELADEGEISVAVDSVYRKGLLWKLSKPGISSSYLFGTIHVSDENITNFDEKIKRAVDTSSIFVMEVFPNPAEVMAASSLMYFSRGQKLSDMISAPLFEEVVTLLLPYHLPREAISLLKPWGAFLTMSYPPDFGVVMDLQLLERAKQVGAKIHGLETLHEQIDIFNSMGLDKQLRLLGNTACNYDLLEQDFEKMKALYLDKDLQGLYSYSQRYSPSDELLYNELMQKLLIDRNYTMTERMQTYLDMGDAFVAIGAMHLAGEEGVLSLLAKNGYNISLEY